MKSDFLTQLKEADNFTFTENGAVALKSTGNSMVDAFGSLGAMKDCEPNDILRIFYKAFAEDRSLAMKLLFYIRDIRGGQGMRRVFRIIARSLANSYPDLVVKNLDNFLFFGRGDDVLCLIDTPVEEEVIRWIGDVLQCDMINLEDKGVYPTLLAKWLPSENASSIEGKYLARKIAKGLGMTPREYRKTLSKLRQKIGIVESMMSQGKWESIDFEKLPAKASMIYSDAFMRHVEDNYVNYLKALANGDAKVNAASLFPVDIIHKVYENRWNGSRSLKDKYLLSAMWNALPDYFSNEEETGLCVVDTSGSMSGIPIEVALSLGIYCADKAKGPFHNHFINFSQKPTLQELKGNDICEKVDNLDYNNWDGNTNIEAVFDLILSTAIANHTPQEDLPSKLYIISDMQFDEARGSYNYEWRKSKPKTFMQEMKQKYANAGYTLPAIVYWNVRESDCGMFQETFEGENCCMVSGYSSSLFKSVIEGTEYEEEVVVTEKGENKVVTKQKIDPVNVMLTTLNNERYDRVVTN